MSEAIKFKSSSHDNHSDIIRELTQRRDEFENRESELQSQLHAQEKHVGRLQEALETARDKIIELEGVVASSKADSASVSAHKDDMEQIDR